MEWIKDQYRISDDKAELDLFYLQSALAESYWAADRSLEVIRASIANSLCFGLFTEGRQIGFARVVTDRCTFAWICDVMVHPDHRSTGLGKWLMDCLEEHPWIVGVEQQLLRTQDAHGLYERFGYTVCDAMVRRRGQSW